MPTEADTCRKFVVPKLQAAGWDNDPHSIAEQRFFTAGRIVAQGGGAKRRPGKRADYFLRYTRDFPLAVVEAKAAYKQAAAGLQQAEDYATISASRSPPPPIGTRDVQTNRMQLQGGWFVSPEKFEELQQADKIPEGDLHAWTTMRFLRNRFSHATSQSIRSRQDAAKALAYTSELLNRLFKCDGD